MTALQLHERFRELCREDLPRPGDGRTPERHRRIFAAGREDLSLAKLAEAHWDAVAILHEAGMEPASGATYAVWASELPGQPLQLAKDRVSGRKEFCSGAGIVDRALLTAGETLVEIDLHAAPAALQTDSSVWQTDAFRYTQTWSLTFEDYPVACIVGEGNWYVQRPGFWQGACGPAAAWAGGAAGLLDYALRSRREDAHSIVHLAAMHADVWAMETWLQAAGEEFDRAPQAHAMTRALAVRHLIEQACTDVLRRFGRMLGPAPLAKDAGIARRCAELELFLRQSHAERDLESLGRALRKHAAGT